MPPNKLDPHVKAARLLATAAESYLHHMHTKPEGARAAKALEKLKAAVAAFPKS